MIDEPDQESLWVAHELDGHTERGRWGLGGQRLYVVPELKESKLILLMPRKP
jgi:hypothetical protein